MQEELEKLEKKYSIDWREYEIGELFDVQTTKKKFNAQDIKFGGKYRYVARGESNNGIRGYIDEDTQYLNSGNTISFGQDTATMFYQEEPYFTGDKIKVFQPKENVKLNRKTALFFISSMKKAFSTFSWGSSSYNVAVLNSTKIILPTQNKKIAFDYIEEFLATLDAERLATLDAERLATLDAYLIKTKLKDYILTEEESEALAKIESVKWGAITFDKLFSNIQQGARLKKADQIDGDIPFIMAGTTSTGVVKYISNPVRSFPKNSLTIDIFGNTFYRDYSFGAGDDTGVFWNDDNKFDKYQMLFLAAQINKALAGRYDFGNKLRASQTIDFEIFLPFKSDLTPDFAFMATYIKAMQKVVIKNVVEWADKRIEKTKEVIDKK